MREILFKAKRIISNGEWVEGYFTKRNGIPYICEDFENKYGIRNVYEIDESTLCQYTGLTDKNGKKVYEGDILKTEDNNAYYNYLVKFDEEELSYELYGNDDLPYRFTCTMNNQQIFEVIGNIFDNPELLNYADKQANKDVLKLAT